MAVRHKEEGKSHLAATTCPIIQKRLSQITTTMTSAADIRSVLSVPDPVPSSSQQPQKKPAASKRPQGISRELYELIGDSVPSVVPQQSRPRLKLKPNLGSGPPRSRWYVYSIFYVHECSELWEFSVGNGVSSGMERERMD